MIGLVTLLLVLGHYKQRLRAQQMLFLVHQLNLTQSYLQIIA